MTPDQLAALLTRLLGAPVRLRPDLDHAPFRWTTTALRDHARRDPASVRAAAEAASDLPGVQMTDGVLVLDVELSSVARLFDGAPTEHDLDGVRRSLASARRPDVSLRLTRDDETTTYHALATQVGDAAARWALARSADGRQIDVAVADLSRQTLANPVLVVQLAHARLTTLKPPTGGGRVLALAAEWPVAVAETAVGGRTRPLALHIERLADEVLTWLGSDAGEGPACWTPARLADTARIVLATGLDTAGIPAPARI